MEKLLVAITEVEGLADALAVARQQMLDLDIQRQGVREAARAVQKKHKEPTYRSYVWIALHGAVPMNMMAHEALRWLDAESGRLEEEIVKLRQKQKTLLSAITDKSGVPDGCSPEMLKACLTLKDAE